MSLLFNGKNTKNTLKESTTFIVLKNIRKIAV